MIEPGTVIDSRYEVLSRIGSGGMADVYLARDQLLGRQVALKLLQHRFAEDQEFVERFRREASSAAGLSHPNVVAVFDRGEWDGTYYIAMEYLPGRSLKAIVREDGPLAPAAAIDVVVQILRAARFAHRRGIIHRDLKPHNVILDEEGRAKVTDFGIARAGASDMTLTGSIMGTAQYLSPEQAQGEAVSASSDLYAVGIVLYELLTGAVPFDGETAVAIALKQVSAVPPPPSALNPAVGPELDAVVLKALAKDPAERFLDAEEFISALQRIPAAPTEVRPTPAVGPAPTVLAESPTGLLLPPAQLPPAQESSSSPRAWWWALAAVLVAAAAVAAVLLLSPSSSKVSTPAVTGQSEAVALATLRRAGLQGVPTQSSSSTAPAGTVEQQSPVAGSRVKRGTRVAIVVSSGPRKVAVPDVKGAKEALALQRLRAAGLQPTVRAQPNSVLAQGLAIATEPAAGTEAQAGSAVTVLVSSGPATVKVPSVLGKSKAEASAILSAAGLALGASTAQVSASQTPGTVLSQSPAAGASARSGAKVAVTLARAPKDVAVPDVLGQSETQASASLGGAGFVPELATRTVTDPTQVGNVVQQSPVAGHRAPRGATVTITVGTLEASSTSSTTTAPASSTTSTTTSSATTTTTSTVP